MTLWNIFIAPFAEYAFMRRALVGCAALAVGAGPLGVFVVLRRMSLMGDAFSHAILPGVAVAFLLFGLSLPAMSVGGFAAGVAIVVGAGAIARNTTLAEDASFACLFVLSLSGGVMMLSLGGNALDLVHILFGSALAVDDEMLALILGAETLTLLGFALILRPLVIDCFDPGFLRVAGGGRWVNPLFLSLVVINLVAAFQAIGTLLALGLMILPAGAGSFWTMRLWPRIVFAVVVGVVSCYVGLLASFHYDLPTGPAIVLSAGAVYAFSILFGRFGGLVRRPKARAAAG
jgi:zinc/manganese transport system permease protein